MAIPGTVSVSANLGFAASPISGTTVGIANTTFTTTNGDFVWASQSIPTTATALNLGAVTSPGWLLIKNLDTTNFVQLYTATGGVPIAKLAPNGGFALLPLDPTLTAPAAKSNTAACEVQYLLCSA